MDGYRRVRESLGAAGEYLFDEKLRETAEELRQPFLDFVAEMGRCQKDPIRWWSRRFSWKVWSASDLFLLICYLVVAERCIEEANRRGLSLAVLVEDPWLLRQIKENLKSTHPDIPVEEWNPLTECARCTFLGMTRRAWWLFRTLRGLRRQRRLWPHVSPPVAGTQAVGIFSYASKSAFELPGLWQDSHLPKLDRPHLAQFLRHRPLVYLDLGRLPASRRRIRHDIPRRRKFDLPHAVQRQHQAATYHVPRLAVLLHPAPGRA